MIAFTFRQALRGVFTDEALRGLVGQITTATAVGLGEDLMPGAAGRYRVTAVVRVTEPDYLTLPGCTDVLISFEPVNDGAQPGASA